MRLLSAKVSELESRYIVIKNNITAEMAFELGFKEVEAKSYITKPALGLSY
jgi:hypothetical protein